jgi:lipopolysaccharide/colanic/teichoic acid biosynthesis glycosyltransferase
VFSGRPVLFRQERVGLKGKKFWIYKFRTMRLGAEKERDGLLKQNEADGPVFKIRNDPRYTNIGRFLSHTGLDELPQMINIVKGEMALVGPRPLPVEEEKQIDKKYRKVRESVRPGIISLWIVSGYHGVKFREWMEMDCLYARKKSLWFDTRLVIGAGILGLRLMRNEIGKLVGYGGFLKTVD